MNIPKRIALAHLPTPVEPAHKEHYPNLYLKRDDYSGIEVSGNKVRKLEFAIQQALEQKAQVLITCGGVQSNHARATASCAAKLGLQSHLVLRGQPDEVDGNYFLDILFGAQFTFITQDEYADRMKIMQGIKDDYAKKGLKAYILPEGASNGIGMFGYYSAFEEILKQEKEMQVTFDTICVAEGSGGSYAGLYAANEILGAGKTIIGFNIYDKDADVPASILNIIEEGLQIGGHKPISYEQVHILNEYAGEGYGIADDKTVAFIKDFARKTGIVTDPVYTGKALYGVIQEMQKKNPLFKGNVLYIHTGGIFGVFPKKAIFLK